ncbi:hypothetical protein EDB19DRAFT_1991473 [Suillus lakei]|nr:hypothetical protein EDB19DRAFT_1991473 [Suillus lakei]
MTNMLGTEASIHWRSTAAGMLDLSLIGGHAASNAVAERVIDAPSPSDYDEVLNEPDSVAIQIQSPGVVDAVECLVAESDLPVAAGRESLSPPGSIFGRLPHFKSILSNLLLLYTAQNYGLVHILLDACLRLYTKDTPVQNVAKQWRVSYSYDRGEEFGYILVGGDFGSFVLPSNIIKDRKAVLSLSQRSHGEHRCWEHVPIHRHPLQAFELPEDVAGWYLLKNGKGHTVNGSIRPEGLILVTHVGTHQDFLRQGFST